MEYILKATHIFRNQFDDLSKDAAKIVERKLLLAKQNPFRNKRIVGYELFLFRIRFEDQRKEKRVIYLVDKPNITVLCILDRNKGYADLRKYLMNYRQSKV
ncbi:MAG: hypothetical protein KKG59_03050 [Nanoarchaeota archaeon]|nr:hypothetical protein [Nanoarchaeota archaeon]